MAHTITKYDIFNAQDHYRRVMILPEFKQLKLCQQKSVINLKNKWNNYSQWEGNKNE
tara:strand:+ start:460 stop:630 length:171 start_codon:yes stop_codon:yes gene_type:complete